MGMKLLLILMVLLVGFTTRVDAMPTLVVTESRYEANGDIRYFVTVSGWLATDNTATVCGGEWDYFVRVCQIVLLATRESTSERVVIGGWTTPSRPQIMTMGDIISKLNEQGQFFIPYKSSFILEREYGKASCLSLALSRISGRDIYPFTVCAPVKPVPVECTINGNTTIDHKTLLDNAIDGAQAWTQLTLRCAGNTSVLVKATRTNAYGVRLKHDDSLYSDVKINGIDATDGIDIKVTNNQSPPINITSTLKTRGVVAPGPFSGYTVVTVMPY